MLRSMFDQAFPGQSDPVTVQNMGLAIGAYERVLTTVNLDRALNASPSGRSIRWSFRTA